MVLKRKWIRLLFWDKNVPNLRVPLFDLIANWKWKNLEVEDPNCCQTSRKEHTNHTEPVPVSTWFVYISQVEFMPSILLYHLEYSARRSIIVKLTFCYKLHRCNFTNEISILTSWLWHEYFSFELRSWEVTIWDFNLIITRLFVWALTWNFAKIMSHIY